MKIWHVLSCAQRPGSLPGFLSNSLQRARGSLKTDQLDGTTDTCMEDISPYNVLKKMHAHTHTVLTSVLQLHRIIYYDTCYSFTNTHTHGQIAISHLCSCMVHDVAHRRFWWGPEISIFHFNLLHQLLKRQLTCLQSYHSSWETTKCSDNHLLSLEILWMSMYINS